MQSKNKKQSHVLRSQSPMHCLTEEKKCELMNSSFQDIQIGVDIHLPKKF